jgi:hypothetical protein
MSPLFPLGRVVATPGAIAVMERLEIDPASLLARHVSGDWGDVGAEERAVNGQALRDGSRIMSVFGVPGSDDCIFLLTEAVDDNGERVATTFLRPEDY